MRTAAVFLPLLIAGCSLPYTGKTKFDESEHRPYATENEGTASISGQAFLKTRGGDVKYGAGNRVILLPATSYVMDFYDNAVKKGLSLDAELVEPLRPYARAVTADGEGEFTFERVPAGTYVVICEINWEYAAGYKTGGVAHNLVMVRDGQHKERVVVSQ